MSATIAVSIGVSSGTRPNLPRSVLLRVYPPRGRLIETWIRADETKQIAVDPGEVTVEAAASSGQTESRTVTVKDGQNVVVKLDLRGSTNEGLAWLNVGRDQQQWRRSRPRPLHSMLGGAQVDLLVKRDPAGVQILNDAPYDDARVFHIIDHRASDSLRAAGGSFLAFVQVRDPQSPAAVRVGALPGPFSPPFEAHVALRTVEGDPLPDVQIVTAKPELAPLIGFLERRDQRALVSLRESIVEEALEAMREKQADPIAAAVGLAVLLRLGETEPVRRWSANLWHWFPGLPDGGALHAAMLLRAPQATQAWKDELRKAVLDAARAGVPLLSDSLRHLRDAAIVLTEGEEKETRPKRKGVAAWCDQRVRRMDRDNVFTTLTIEGDASSIWGYQGAEG
jgi:hypothetical protein